MLSVSGIYENGKIRFLEHIPRKGKSDVIITFLENRKEFSSENRLEGLLADLSEDDFSCERSLSEDFWHSPTIEELANAQEIKPLQDITVLFGTWPGEKNDGFEKEITALRQQDIRKVEDV